MLAFKNKPGILAPFVLGIVIVGVLQGSARAATIHVDAASTSLIPDGTQEAPYRTIQDGINSAGIGDRVLVVAGTYLERIFMKDGVDVIGAGADVTFIDATGRGSRPVTFNGVRQAARLEGFTVTGGEGETVATIGGVPVNVGGGIGIFASDAVVTRNVITGNVISEGYAKGGGIYIAGDRQTPHVFNNVISGNVARTADKPDDGKGGGIFVLTKFGRVIITDNVIDSNQATIGGGIYSNNISEADLTIARNTIRYNEAMEGAALYTRDWHTSTTTITSNLMAGNGTTAGYIDCDDLDSGSSPMFDEACNDGVDNDCNPATPDIWDGDGDGYTCDVDCDDTDATIWPLAPEHCADSVDNDCDGLIDWSNPDNVVLVEFGSALTYLANSSNPFLGLDWVASDFDDSGWSGGSFGVGYEDEPPGAQNLLNTTVSSGVASVYTRATFSIDSAAQVNSIYLAADYDDGYVAWINGVEVYRSPEMPVGDPLWNAAPTAHESSNAIVPDYGTLQDISTVGLAQLVDGPNVLAVGVYNDEPGSSPDLVLVPRLSMSYGTDDEDCLVADADSDGYAVDDCDDADGNAYPWNSEVCDDGIDNDCDSDTPDDIDADSDGYNCLLDCDEGDSAINPGMAEVYCDGIDNDCSELTADVVDMDSDFFDCMDDCDDVNPAIRPNVAEFCFDDIDNNCDGFTDENDLECSCPNPVDVDNDGFRCSDCDDGDPDVNPARSEACNDGIDNDCEETTPDIFDGDGDGYTCDLECDDFDPTINPDRLEICNDGKDNDCDGNSDGLDLEDCNCADDDSDGYACFDCDDTEPLANPGLAEICGDLIDNDCDTDTTDDVDADSDGANCNVDCDDNNKAVHPSAGEHCTDGLDNDCDGNIDLALVDHALVEFGTAMAYLDNLEDPGLGLDWVEKTFDDTSWALGHYGVGYQVGPPGTGADYLIVTEVTQGASSVYTRLKFGIPDPAGVNALYWGADYDDGYVVWINGVEVMRSAGMPAGDPAWDADPPLHESSNGTTPDYGPMIDISSVAIPLLEPGVNILAVGLYNDLPDGGGYSSDLVIVPRLAMDYGSDDDDCYCPDYDGDGYSCTDCLDAHPFVNPGAEEIGCDLLDNDCNPATDDIFDADSDGYTCDVDCLDTDPEIHPGATEIPCDGYDNDCDPATPEVTDGDSDGYDCLEDCDDTDGTVNPDATEVPCDLLDNDCDTLTPDKRDEDSDGYTCDLDCDDSDPAFNPVAPEKCDDGLDNNCDDLTDAEDTAACSCADADSDGYQCEDCDDAVAAINPGTAEVCDDLIDNDCDSDTPDDIDADSDGSNCLVDCDDADPFVRPEAAELCDDGKDNDCDPVTLDWYDTDSDGHDCRTDCNEIDPDVNPAAVELCSDGIDNDCNPGTVDVFDADTDGFDCFFDCDDADANINPGADELCNDTIDNDCDPQTADTFDADSDGDLCHLDCDDADPGRFAANPEKCDDGIDNDCDGDVDSADLEACDCPDADSDGYNCLDCDDAVATIHPGAAEVCNDTIDNDCDATTPDDIDADTDGYNCLVDCDEGNDTVNPGAVEVHCDGIDNDCDTDGTPDVVDLDSDGYLCTTDCNDDDSLVNPAAVEVGCDGKDNDCDALTSDLADLDSDGIYCADVTVRGGGINALAWTSGNLIIVNNTLVENSMPVGTGGGMWIDDLQATSPAVLSNNVLYGNAALLGGGLDHTAYFGEISHNSFFNNTNGDLYNAGGSTATKSGNLFIDPRLSSVSTGNYRLASDSPLIDAADPALAPPNDLDRFWRPYDGDGDSDAVADIGAFEFPSGEVFGVLFLGRDTLDWPVRVGDRFFNLYRGGFAALRLQGLFTQNPALPIPDRFCRIAPDELPYTDGYAPDPTKLVFYLVTTTSPTFEGSLGQRTDGRLRNNSFPCP